MSYIILANCNDILAENRAEKYLLDKRMEHARKNGETVSRDELRKDLQNTSRSKSLVHPYDEHGRVLYTNQAGGMWINPSEENKHNLTKDTYLRDKVSKMRKKIVKTHQSTDLDDKINRRYEFNRDTGGKLSDKEFYSKDDIRRFKAENQYFRKERKKLGIDTKNIPGYKNYKSPHNQNMKSLVTKVGKGAAGLGAIGASIYAYNHFKNKQKQ